MKRAGLAAAAVAGLLSIAAARPPAEHWVGTWSTPQQIPEEANALPTADAADATLRQIIRVSIGGKRVRVLISNAFGVEPLRVDSVHLARARAADGSAIDPKTDQALTFNGGAEAFIPAGASAWSDPVAFDAKALDVLAVSLHLPAAPRRQTGHPGARSTSYYVRGDHSADEVLSGARTVEHWYQLAGVAVSAGPAARAVVTLGDSITDGRGSTTNGNNRWSDLLADRLQGSPAHRNIGVLNAGIGGNQILRDGLGPNASARFDRDVLAQPGVRYVIVFEGINDLGGLSRNPAATPEAHRALRAQIIAALDQMVFKARAAGVKIFGATITPDGSSGYYHPDALSEEDRQTINAWIRAPGHFDAVIDFDAVVRDPAEPRNLKKEYDSGDGLHPSVAGYKAMAAAIPLALFN